VKKYYLLGLFLLFIILTYFFFFKYSLFFNQFLINRKKDLPLKYESEIPVYRHEQYIANKKSFLIVIWNNFWHRPGGREPMTLRPLPDSIPTPPNRDFNNLSARLCGRQILYIFTFKYIFLFFHSIFMLFQTH
jgi:hypothetical protein